MRFSEVSRNDIVYAFEKAEDTSGAWNRVVHVSTDYRNQIRLELADGTWLVGYAGELVSVRRLRLLQGGAR